MPLIKNADRHLYEAALADHPPSGTVYKPDGVCLQSLGVHEYWNNAIDKKYSRNLDPAHGTGIELICMPSGDTTNKPAAAGNTPLSPAVLPGKDGAVFWTYTHPGQSEITVAVLQPYGNIPFANQFGVTGITMDKKVEL